jgi:hypothetical protein
MGIAFAVAVLGLALYCLTLGEAAPAGGEAAPTFGSTLDSMSADVVKESGDAAPSDAGPQDAPKPAADKSEGWTKAMTDFEPHIPEGLRHTFRNRVEQGARWGKGVPESSKELDAMKSQFGSVEKFAKVAAGWFSDGEESLRSLGPAKFLEEIQDVDWGLVSRKLGGVAEEVTEEEEPAEEKPPGPSDPRIDKLEKELAALKGQSTKREEAERMQRARAAFDAEYNPEYEKAVAELKIPDDRKESFDNMAKALHLAAIQAGKRPKPSESVQAARAMLEALTPKKQQRQERPASQVIVDPNKEHAAPGGPSGYADALAAFNDGMARDFQQGPGG